MTTLTLEEVCEQLDELLIRQLDLIQEYTDLSLKCEVYQKEGYLNLAKARYILGPNSMSRIQLPREDSEEYSAVLKISNQELRPEDQGTITNNLDDNITIHKRKVILTSADSDSNQKLLRQFGILAPNNVKLGMKNFRESVEICVQRINVSQELLLNQQKFISLHRVKNSLICKNAETEP